jgi:hypothetical protein
MDLNSGPLVSESGPQTTRPAVKMSSWFWTKLGFCDCLIQDMALPRESVHFRWVHSSVVMSCAGDAREMVMWPQCGPPASAHTHRCIVCSTDIVIVTQRWKMWFYVNWVCDVNRPNACHHQRHLGYSSEIRTFYQNYLAMSNKYSYWRHPSPPSPSDRSLS